VPKPSVQRATGSEPAPPPWVGRLPASLAADDTGRAAAQA